MADKIFPEGIRVFSPRQGAPDFVKGSIVISPNILIEWLKKNKELLTDYKGEKQLTLDLLNSKDGKPYLAVNNFKPSDKKEPANDLPF
jgi:hypothetical protein